MSMLEGEEGVRADDDYAKGETSHAEYSCSCLIRYEVGGSARCRLSPI